VQGERSGIREKGEVGEIQNRRVKEKGEAKKVLKQKHKRKMISKGGPEAEA
jgi:hypothetical protein